MNTDIIAIEVHVSRYKGTRVRLEALINTATGIILAHNFNSDLTAPPKKPEITSIITDDTTINSNWDMVFREKDHLQQAITEFKSLKEQGKIQFSAQNKNNLQPFIPDENMFQVVSVDNKGQKYSFDFESVTNKAMAFIILIYGALRVMEADSVVDVFSGDDDDVLTDDDDGLYPFTI